MLKNRPIRFYRNIVLTHYTHILATASLLALASLAPAAAKAQEGSVVSYDQAFFAPFKPVTLRDMIEGIPGGITILNDLNSGGGNRGFGSSGAPILINGRRMSGKSNDMATTFARTQASQVERIDVIRGNAEGLDIRSDGVLYNVILKDDEGGSSVNFIDFSLNYVRETSIGPEFLLSHSGAKGKLDYGISFEFEKRPRLYKTAERVLNADLTQREFRFLTQENLSDERTITGNIGYEFESGYRVRLNGLYGTDDYTRNGYEDQFLIGAGGAQTPSANDAELYDSDKEGWEIGGDIEGGLGALGTFKALFVVNSEDRIEFISQDDIVGGVSSRYFTGDSNYNEQEKIMRASVTSLVGDHTFEYGGEGAFNKLDNATSFNFAPIEQTIVKEDRYDIFVTHSTNLAPKLNIQSAVNLEFSNIKQDSAGARNSRNFQYWKPRLEIRYDFDDNNQVRLLTERRVSQLNLRDFVATRNTDDDTINFGNPNLVPEKKWAYEASYEHRLINDGGSAKITFFYEDISDLIDRILIGTASSGIGNIGDARVYGVSFDASIRLDFIGLKNALFTIEYNINDSEATDPFTGEKRELRDRTPRFWRMDFQQDFPDWNFTYGINAHLRSNQNRQDVRLRVRSTYRPHVFAFMEYGLSNSVKLRFDAGHIFNDWKGYFKTYYLGNLATSGVDFIEDQVVKSNVDFKLRLQATF